MSGIKTEYLKGNTSDNNEIIHFEEGKTKEKEADDKFNSRLKCNKNSKS